MREWWSKISRALHLRRGLDDDLSDEMRAHLELITDENIERGMTPDDARAAARRHFGNLTRTKENARESWQFPRFEDTVQDIRYGVRGMRKAPGFSATVILTLALGIGANTAIFSICNAVLFKALPYADPDRIMMLWETMREGKRMTVAPANFVDWRDTSRSFSQMAAVRPNYGFTLAAQNEPVRLTGAGASANFFSLLGIRFAFGRGFVPQEDGPGHNHVVILSHRVWQQRFGGDAGIIGRTIKLNDDLYSVVGVLPADFQFATTAADFQANSQIDVWTPLALDLEKLQRGTHPLRVITRLKPEVNLSQAQAELNILGANLARTYPMDNKDKGIAAVPMAEQVTANIRVALEALLSAVGMVLLIACANVANLLLSRVTARQREMAVRVALGASRWRLTEQLLTESLLLSGLGGMAGLAFSFAAIRFVTPLLPSDLSRAAGIAVDERMLVFTVAISLFAGVLFGLGPLLGTRRVNPQESLKETNRVASGGQSALRSSLAVFQIGIAIVLLIGAGLMAKSFWALIHVPPGFRTENVLTARLSLPESRYADNRRIAAFERQVLEGLNGRSGFNLQDLPHTFP